MKKMHNHSGFVMALVLIAVLATILPTGAAPTIASVKETVFPVIDVFGKILSPVWKFLVWFSDLVSKAQNIL